MNSMPLVKQECPKCSWPLELTFKSSDSLATLQCTFCSYERKTEISLYGSHSKQTIEKFVNDVLLVETALKKK